jgi:hypothetical protein
MKSLLQKAGLWPAYPISGELNLLFEPNCLADVSMEDLSLET